MTAFIGVRISRLQAAKNALSASMLPLPVPPASLMVVATQSPGGKAGYVFRRARVRGEGGAVEPVVAVAGAPALRGRTDLGEVTATWADATLTVIEGADPSATRRR